MPLGQRRVIRTEHQRQVREARRREAERAIEQHLPRRVRDVILAADHMRHLHQRIVDDDGEVVGGTAVGAHQHRIADHVGAERDLAAHEILERDVDVLGHAEADDGALAALEPLARLLRRDRAAGAVIFRRAAGGEIATAIVLEFLRRAEAVVGVAAGEQLVGVRRIEMQPLGLPIRARRCRRRPVPRPTRARASAGRRGCSPRTALVDRSASVSSMRRMNVPSWPRASSQLKSAVRALPTWSCPVGLGAKRTLTDTSMPTPADASEVGDQARRRARQSPRRGRPRPRPRWSFP